MCTDSLTTQETTHKMCTDSQDVTTQGTTHKMCTDSLTTQGTTHKGDVY